MKITTYKYQQSTHALTSFWLAFCDLKSYLYQKRYYCLIEICTLSTYKLTSRCPKISGNFPMILPGTTFSFILFLLTRLCKDPSPGLTATSATVRVERRVTSLSSASYNPASEWTGGSK